MSAAFDPYHRWLRHLAEQQPAEPYRLLGIDRFEPDPEVIRDAAERQMAHVRTYQLGEYTELTQRILNELAAAKACLLDPARKSAYDGQLRAQSGKGDNRPLADDTKPATASQRCLVGARRRAVRARRACPPIPVTWPMSNLRPRRPLGGPGAMLPPSAKQGLAGSPAWTQLTRGGPIRRTLHRIDAMLLGVVGKDNVLLHRCLRILAVAYRSPRAGDLPCAVPVCGWRCAFAAPARRWRFTKITRLASNLFRRRRLPFLNPPANHRLPPSSRLGPHGHRAQALLNRSQRDASCVCRRSPRKR